jgi:NADH-quinone oxidoreductase subunit H
LLPYLVAMIAIPLSPNAVGAELDIGIFFVLAVLGIAVLGPLMASWASANKFALLGGLRQSAQLMAYELPLVLAAASVCMAAGSLSLVTIVDQWQPWWLVWQIGAMVVFFIAALAELSRPPFDMPLADSEIIMGPLTEYTGLRFALFLLSEYAGILVFSALTAVLFLGGWHGPGPDWLAPVWTLLKTLAVAFVVIWLRVSVPRLREDQLQRLAWVVLVPVALAQLVVTAVVRIG